MKDPLRTKNMWNAFPKTPVKRLEVIMGLVIIVSGLTAGVFIIRYFLGC